MKKWQDFFLSDHTSTLRKDRQQNAEKSGLENSNKSSDNAERNVVQSVSEKTVDESTKETNETAETPKRHWWQ